MKLGLFTACLPLLSLDDIAAWASRSGFQALEAAAWPPGSQHPYQACHLDAASFTPQCADHVRGLLRRHDLTLSAISYYANNLHPSDRERERIHTHLRRCVDAAVALDVACVGTFIGRDPAQTVADNLRNAERYLPPLTRYAADYGVRLVIENCPMEGWHPDGYPGNLAYSPELWDWLSSLGFYLNYDPSHLAWLGIDPIDALRPCLARGQILHVQAKDIEIDAQQRTRYGIFGKTVERRSPEDVGWWRYRIPGTGQLDWQAIITALHDGGFDGTVAVEHEDPIWTGTEDKIKQGLGLAVRTLQPLIAARRSP